jgi:anaerobic selenocysteine-containing dehydrogenase
MQRIAATCPHDCPSVCALEVERIDSHTIGGVYGSKSQTYTDGVICAKVARYKDRIHHPQRLTQPLLRTGAKGQGIEAFETISWDQAMDMMVEKFAAITAKHGAEAIWPYHYAGTMGLVQRDSIDRLSNALGYSRQKSTICTTLADAGYIAGTGLKRGIDPREMKHSSLIVVWGGNPVHTQINVMHHINKARNNNNAKLIVIDPYRTATAQKADLHLMLKPGTDGALACAVMHCLFRDGHADWDYLNKYTDDPRGLEKHLQNRTPAWAAEITGLIEADIETFAQWYGDNPQSFIRLGYGFSRSRNGAFNMHAASCLPAVTGAWKHLGGGALYSNSAMYPVDLNTIKGLDCIDEATREFDQSRIGPVLTNNKRDLQGKTPVKALLIQNTNPLAVCPESNLVRQGFERNDLFICVHEQFMTETAAMADLVLPATMFLEHDDIYLGGGHTHLQVSRKVIEPPGECRSNLWVINELGRRLGSQHAGFKMSEVELMKDSVVQGGVVDWQELWQKNFVDCAIPFDDAHYLNGFGHSDGKFHFRHGWDELLLGKVNTSSFPDHVAITDPTTAKQRWRLVTAPARHFLNTSFTEAPFSLRLEKQPDLMIHPKDCLALGVKNGDLVEIGNDRGQLILPVKEYDGLQQGVLVSESIWPNKAFAGNVGINALTSAEPGLPYGGAVFHDTSVWVRPCIKE